MKFHSPALKGPQLVKGFSGLFWEQQEEREDGLGQWGAPTLQRYKEPVRGRRPQDGSKEESSSGKEDSILGTLPGENGERRQPVAGKTAYVSIDDRWGWG